jgi:hypothetical protein
MRTIGLGSLLVVALLVAWVGLGGPGRVSAQEGTPETDVLVTVDEEPPADEGGATQLQFGDTSDATAIRLDPAMAFVIVLVLLALAVIVLALLFRYLSESRRDYYDTIREFARKGVFFSPVLVSPTTTTEAALEAMGGAADTFEVAGPGLVAPGQEAVFTALRNGVAAESTVWSLSTPSGDIVPAESAALDRGSGPSVTLTATKPGLYVLTATQPGPPDLVMRSAITVATAATGDEKLPELPFIGQGFGAIVGAVVVIAALVALAATRAIDADVVGVILGALTGYLFGVGVTQSRG